MTRPLVSIVIDNYNYGRFVGAAIRSALAQSYEPLEVIVVDDGSTDGSWSIIAGFGDRIRAIRQENGGQSAAFNTGFAASRGDIVIFLDSDDALHPEAAAEAVRHVRPGVSKVQFALATVDARGRFLGNIFPNFPAGLAPAEIRDEALRSALYPCPPTSGNAYTRSFLERVMPLPKVPCGADGPINTVAPLYGDVVTINRPLAWYRVHGQNDGAQQTLAPEKFARFIRHDQSRVEFLRRHAAALGVSIDGDPLDRAILHLQYRLASLVLRPEDHPIAGETRADVVSRAIRAAAKLRDGAASKAALVAWFLAVAAAPRGTAEKLIAFRFVPGSRPKLIGSVLRGLRVLRPPRAAEDLSVPETFAAS
ncbi:MAG: glycosyltransferase [Rhodospirillales bacterium]|nr:glycosyltransferase [Rhodospirillales bacterium]